MKKGDLVKFTFAATSSFINKENESQYAILVEEQDLPLGSWIILIEGRGLFHASLEELEVISEKG
jgi:hypothetical protein